MTKLDLPNHIKHLIAHRKVKLINHCLERTLRHGARRRLSATERNFMKRLTLADLVEAGLATGYLDGDWEDVRESTVIDLWLDLVICSDEILKYYGRDMGSTSAA